MADVVPGLDLFDFHYTSFIRFGSRWFVLGSIFVIFSTPALVDSVPDRCCSSWFGSVAF